MPKKMSLKATILFIIFGISIQIQNASAQVCSDPLNVIYGVTSSGDVVPVNVNDASIGAPLTSSGDAGYPGSTNIANSIGLDIQTGTFYYFQNNAAGTQQFVSFNAMTNTYAVLANSPITGTVVKGCVSADGKGYYCIDGNAQLCYYNILTNTWVSIGSNLVDQFSNNLAATFSSLGNGDMAIDGLGNLWIIASSTRHWGLYKLSAPLPTAATPVVTLAEMIPPSKFTPSGSAFVGIAYNATGQIYLSTVNDLYLLQSDLSITHINTYSNTGVVVDLTSCNYPFGVLPLSWKSFTATLQNNNSVLLSWSLNQQINNKGYNIERSVDGKKWDSIGYKGNNRQQGIAAYTFTDANAGREINYYRIEALNLDGNISYSEIETINIERNSSISIWPVPATNKINIETPGNTNINNGNAKIFNTSGQRVAACIIHGGTNTIDISSLPAGTYIVHIRLSNGKVTNQKLVKL